jgi:dienelactone hydrolase
MVGGSFLSRARRGARCSWAISYPPGASGRMPVVVVLHGRGADHASAFGTYIALDRFQALAVAGGAAPFAVASVDGGDTYWHRRASGEDAGAMVLDDLLPLLGRRGLDIRRIGLLGWSMGGYGALLLAGRLGPGRVAAVVAESPALWHRAADSAPGAFDDAADFRAHTVFGHERQMSGIPVRVECGTGDPFYPAARDYVDALSPRPAGGFQPGGHDPGYWRRMAPQQLAFLAAHLSPTG